MEENGYIDAAVLSDCKRSPTNIAGRRGDYMWINKELETFFLTYSVINKKDMYYSSEGGGYLSDHLPLFVTVGDRHV